MSLHNTVEVKEEPSCDGSENRPYTRDRFGKKHPLNHPLDKKILTILLFVALFNGSMAWAEGGRNTNISVDSSELGPVSINDKVKTKQDRQSLQIDEDVSLGFNEDGDPNVGMRF